MKKIIISSLATIALSLAFACSGGDQEASTGAPRLAEDQRPPADPKGIGEVKNVELTDPLNDSFIASGKSIYEMKCSACHKLTDQRVVGPGWEGITNKRRPEWIMNMITNVDVMLEEDPVAQKLLEECLTRMPNQSVSIGDARDLLEYMRFNDMDRVGEKDGAVQS